MVDGKECRASHRELAKDWKRTKKSIEMHHDLPFLDATGRNTMGYTSASVLLQSCRKQGKSERWVACRGEAKRKNERLGWEASLEGGKRHFYCNV
jgi:hypothetical protein